MPNTENDRDMELKELLTTFKESSYSMKLEGIPLLEYTFTDEEWRCLITMLLKDLLNIEQQMECNERFYRFNINSLLNLLRERNNKK